MKPVFIAFEGIDGCGKSTQIRLLSEWMNKNGIKNTSEYEPTPGFVGKLIRQVLSGNQKADPRTMALLFAADRVEHINSVNADLISGISVLCDRYYLSSLAYQSADMPIEWVYELNKYALETAKPDLHIFIDVSPKICLERIKKSRDNIDIFENEKRLTLARENFIGIIEKSKKSENIVIINGEQPENTVFATVLTAVKALF